LAECSANPSEGVCPDPKESGQCPRLPRFQDLLDAIECPKHSTPPRELARIDEQAGSRANHFWAPNGFQQLLRLSWGQIIETNK
jgi:hypothetical protein